MAHPLALSGCPAGRHPQSPQSRGEPGTTEPGTCPQLAVALRPAHSLLREELPSSLAWASLPKTPAVPWRKRDRKHLRDKGWEGAGSGPHARLPKTRRSASASNAHLQGEAAAAPRAIQTEGGAGRPGRTRRKQAARTHPRPHRERTHCTSAPLEPAPPCPVGPRGSLSALTRSPEFTANSAAILEEDCGRRPAADRTPGQEACPWRRLNRKAPRVPLTAAREARAGGHKTLHPDLLHRQRVPLRPFPFK